MLLTIDFLSTEMSNSLAWAYPLEMGEEEEEIYSP